MDAQALAEWVGSLDELTYYELLGLDPHASPDDVKSAFHVFADTFHPDVHAARSEPEREQVALVFKHANEAYRVLADPQLRAHYDSLLKDGTSPQVASRRSTLPPPSREGVGPRRLVDHLTAPTARPFAIRADELLRRGDLKQAKLQLVLAAHHEPQNAFLKAFLAELEKKIAATPKK